MVRTLPCSLLGSRSHRTVSRVITTHLLLVFNRFSSRLFLRASLPLWPPPSPALPSLLQNKSFAFVAIDVSPIKRKVQDLYSETIRWLLDILTRNATRDLHDLNNFFEDALRVLREVPGDLDALKYHVTKHEVHRGALCSGLLAF